jgi:hypothetical protein
MISLKSLALVLIILLVIVLVNCQWRGRHHRHHKRDRANSNTNANTNVNTNTNTNSNDPFDMLGYRDILNQVSFGALAKPIMNNSMLPSVTRWDSINDVNNKDKKKFR